MTERLIHMNKVGEIPILVSTPQIQMISRRTAYTSRKGTYINIDGRRLYLVPIRTQDFAGVTVSFCWPDHCYGVI